MNRLLGKEICRLREKAGLTQQKLANQLGMSQGKYARLECGINDITLDLLVKLADILHTTVAELTATVEQYDSTSRFISDQSDRTGIQTVHNMLDLFYANKHVYERMHVFDETKKEKSKD